MVKKTEYRFWSHVGQRDRFVISGRGVPKRGEKSWRETFKTIGVQVRSLSRSKFRKFDSWSHLKRTEIRFWLHDGQKDRFIIFGCGAPKMGKKYWGETLCTTGVKFRRESEMPRGHLAIKVQEGHSALERVPPRHSTPDGSK